MSNNNGNATCSLNPVLSSDHNMTIDPEFNFIYVHDEKQAEIISFKDASMKKHSHEFVDRYSGFVGFGYNRKTDENTIIYYLQKFADDNFIKTMSPRMSDAELEEVFILINRLLKTHLTEEEYHRLFLKDTGH